MKNRLMVAMVVAAGILLAQGPGGEGRFGGPAGMGPRGAALGNADALKTALGLSDSQVQQLRDLRKQQAESVKPTMDQIRAKRQELAEAMKSATPDSALVGQLMVDIRKLTDSLSSVRDDREAKALALLTPDQKAKLAPLQEAQKLMPAVAEATALGLLEPPQPQARNAANRAMVRRPARQ